MIKLEPISPIPNPTKENILNQLSQKKDIRDLINYFTSDRYYQDEIYQELFLYLCEMDDKKLIDIYTRNKLNAYISGYLKKSLKYNDSMFFYKIKQHISRAQDVEDRVDDYLDIILNDYDFSTEMKHQFLDQFDIQMEKLEFFDKNILKDYLKLGTIKAVSKKQKISTNYISQSLAESKKFLKKTILNNIQDIENQKII